MRLQFVLGGFTTRRLTTFRNTPPLQEGVGVSAPGEVYSAGASQQPERARQAAQPYNDALSPPKLGAARSAGGIVAKSPKIGGRRYRMGAWYKIGGARYRLGAWSQIGGGRGAPPA